MNKIWDALINKMHIAIGTLWAIALLVYRWKTGNEISPGLQNVTYAFYGFLLGHAYTYQTHPDSPQQ